MCVILLDKLYQNRPIRSMKLTAYKQLIPNQDAIQAVSSLMM